MFKKKKSEKQPVAIPSPEQKVLNPKQKKRRNRRIFRLIVLALLLGFGWAGYHNLKHKSMAQIPAKTGTPFTIQPAKSVPVNPNDVDTSNVKKSSVLFQQPSNLSTDIKNSIQPETLKENSDETANKAEHPKEPEAPILTVEETDIPNETPNQLETDIEQDLSVSGTQTYTLRDALAFRDHFLSEQPCGEDFRKLILSDNKTNTAQEVIKNTSYFCLTTNNVYGELTNAFISAKQNALIRYYYEKDNEWMAKIKSTLLHVIQIRNLNPNSDDTPAVLDKAHNAIEAKNIALATELIASLPDNLQNDFDGFLKKAENYAEAASSLERLILSYAKGE